MRKLKLQMQVTADGFVAGPEGQLDWMTPHASDERLNAFINQLIDTSDTILLGRKMTDGFVNYWERVTTQPGSPEYAFARKMVDTPKIVFSGTVKHVKGKNIRVETGDLAQAVSELKRRAGKDILVYGGASFVSSLIEAGLIDELHFFINPVAIGRGMRVFKARAPLNLTASTAYPSGIVVNSYARRRADA
ncbi:MAG: dihydrofolate reductase family protein [Gemmatimonadales bacterium]